MLDRLNGIFDYNFLEVSCFVIKIYLHMVVRKCEQTYLFSVKCYFTVVQNNHRPGSFLLFILNSYLKVSESLRNFSDLNVSLILLNKYIFHSKFCI